MGIIILFFSAVAGVLAGVVVGIVALHFQSKREYKGVAFVRGFLLGGIIGFSVTFYYIAFVS